MKVRYHRKSSAHKAARGHYRKNVQYVRPTKRGFTLYSYPKDSVGHNRRRVYYQRPATKADFDRIDKAARRMLELKRNGRRRKGRYCKHGFFVPEEAFTIEKGGMKIVANACPLCAVEKDMTTEPTVFRCKDCGLTLYGEEERAAREHEFFAPGHVVEGFNREEIWGPGKEGLERKPEEEEAQEREDVRKHAGTLISNDPEGQPVTVPTKRPLEIYDHIVNGGLAFISFSFKDDDDGYEIYDHDLKQWVHATANAFTMSPDHVKNLSIDDKGVMTFDGFFPRMMVNPGMVKSVARHISKEESEERSRTSVFGGPPPGDVVEVEMRIRPEAIDSAHLTIGKALGTKPKIDWPEH